MTYLKIPCIFKFDGNSHKPCGFTDLWNNLKDLQWIATEKVDGTNIRIIWDGFRITFAGRTDKATIPPRLLDYLEKTFHAEGVEELFEQTFGAKPTIIFGEGYGAGIQTGGGLYRQDNSFIVFDVCCDGYWLSYDNVADVASKLGLNVVKLIGKGTLQTFYDYVASNPPSDINPKHEMEGVVCTPVYPLYDREGNPIKTKIKIRDIRSYEGE